MNENTSWDWEKILFRSAVAVYVIACIGYYFHAVDLNPQFDTQGIRYAGELLNAKDQGQLWSWLTQLPPRKYPMLFVAPFSLVGSFFWVPGEGMPLITIHYITRALVLFYACGVFFVLRRIARLLFNDTRVTTLLLMTSVNFFMFSTAVRPHVAAAFWTHLTFYLSLQMRQQPSRRATVLTFGSAACAFAVLQSGIFAFIFPIWALWSPSRSLGSAAKALLLAAGFGAIALAFGYPFVLNVLSGSASIVTLKSGMDHEVGIFMLPQLIPVKLWEMFTCDVVLFIAAGFGLWRSWHQKEKIMPVLIYLAVFAIVFGSQPITGPRFFVPILPLVALIATPALIGRRTLQMCIAVLCILMFGKLALLANRQNTYQQASQFVNTHDGLLLTNTLSYFLNIPEEKFAKEDQEASRFFYLMKDGEYYSELATLPLCASFVATNVSTEAAGVRYMFFWHEVRWPMYYLAVTKSLGINLRIYCSRAL